MTNGRRPKILTAPLGALECGAIDPPTAMEPSNVEIDVTAIHFECVRALDSRSKGQTSRSIFGAQAALLKRRARSRFEIEARRRATHLVVFVDRSKWLDEEAMQNGANDSTDRPTD